MTGHTEIVLVLHSNMNGAVNNKHIPDFQSADLTWQKTDENKGRDFLTQYYKKECKN